MPLTPRTGFDRLAATFPTAAALLMNTGPPPDGTRTGTAPSATRRRKWPGRLLLLCLSLGFVAILCEVSVRLFCPPFIMPRWVENAPYGIRKQIGNIRGFIVTPQYRHQLSTNSKGFRGTREYAIPKPANVFRVVALGDSVVNGYGVEDEQTFSAVLEKKLSTKRPAEVVNMGVPGFGNAEELIQLEHVGFEYQPDLVILGYFVNDHFENITSDLYRLQDGKLVPNPHVKEPSIYLRDRLSRIPGYTFLCQHSYLVNFLRLKASGFFRGTLSRKHALGFNSYTGESVTEEQLTLTSALNDEIIRRLDAKPAGRSAQAKGARAHRGCGEGDLAGGKHLEHRKARIVSSESARARADRRLARRVHHPGSLETVAGPLPSAA